MQQFIKADEMEQTNADYAHARRVYTAIDKVVAQVSKPAVSQVSNLQITNSFRHSADWEIGDTADLEVCATGIDFQVLTSTLSLAVVRSHGPGNFAGI